MTIPATSVDGVLVGSVGGNSNEKIETPSVKDGSIADGNNSKDNAVVDNNTSVGFTSWEGKREVGTFQVHGVLVGALGGSTAVGVETEAAAGLAELSTLDNNFGREGQDF